MKALRIRRFLLRFVISGILGSIFFLGCRSKGNVEAISTRGARAGTLALGLIENRDYHYGANVAQDLSDLLTFELLKAGYQVQVVDPSLIEALEPATPAAPKKNSDDTRDLMPEYMRNLAGEMRPRVADRVRTRFLNPDEIRKLSQKTSFQYFLQGAISRNEAGNLVDPEESFLVMVNAFNADGTRSGAISFTVRNTSLAEAGFLKQVCARIAQAFDQQVIRGVVVERKFTDVIREAFTL